MRLPDRHARAAFAPAGAAALIAGVFLAAGCGGWDSGGGGGSIPILGPAPTADIAAERTLVKAGVAVAFSLDVEGLAPQTFAWDFGDGEGLEGEGLSDASHSYAVEGSYVVTATATDASGNDVSASVTIDVTPAGGAPVLTVESVELGGAVTDATPCVVTVNGEGPLGIEGGAFTWQGDLDSSPKDCEVRAVDEGGNVTTRTVTITITD